MLPQSELREAHQEQGGRSQAGWGRNTGQEFSAGTVAASTAARSSGTRPLSTACPAADLPCLLRTSRGSQEMSLNVTIVYTHMHTHVCIHICTRVPTHAHSHMCTRAHMYVHTYSHTANACVCVHCTHIPRVHAMHTRAHTCPHACGHRHNACTHTHRLVSFSEEVAKAGRCI